jgi:hypothetical protein
MKWSVNLLQHYTDSEFSPLLVNTKEGVTFVADMAVFVLIA